MRKSFVCVMLALVPLCLATARAQTVDEIVAKNLEARGGADKLRAIQSMKIVAKSVAMGNEAPMTMWYKRPDRIRLEITVQGQKIVQAYDGKTAWWIMPFLGATEPQPMPPDQAKTFRENAEFDTPFLDYQKRGIQIELLGEDLLEGTPVYKVRVTKPSGRTYLYYLDKETGIELKQATETEVQGQKVLIETVFGDYKEVDGIVFPFSVQILQNGQPVATYTVESIEFNPDIDDSLFQMPPTGTGV